MMSYTDLPISLWGHALLSANYILNRVPTKSTPRIPYAIWYGKEPSLKHIKIWGCSAYIKKLITDKLESRSIMGRFVGYPKDNLGYYFYIPSEQTIVISRDVVFLENQFIQEVGKERNIELDEESSKDQQNDTMEIDQTHSEPELVKSTKTSRRSSRVSHPPERYGFLHDIQELFIHGENDQIVDPSTYEEAIYDIDSSR